MADNKDRFGRGRVAIVTGGSRGIGKGIGLALGKCGFSVVLNFLNGEAEARSVVGAIEAGGGNALAVRADVSSMAVGEALFDAAEERFGRVDILINNAGALRVGKVADMDPDVFMNIVATNLFGTFSTTRQAVTRLRDGGRIVNLSSTSLHMALPGYAAYNAAKAAIEAMTKVVAKEVAGRGITANAIAPGPTSTELFFAGKNQETIEAMKEMSPFRRLGEVDDIVPLVTFLCRPEAMWVNGQTIRANGGLA